ncbi:SUKH-4 family immunity protein [Streptomyces sp. TRM S81-3]|uniref:SUKH-4 family immunity protein n=1 Tax=Streptomyces griseicoloratus TaxID=2752516 RepID=A0A926QVB7_9ACTN|nr:SUKH-4 family immunity protein [Streptomyces griseicoloratus]MBD0425048.1 SUKH-4 family immunity protein [Streptomyces griseicoloratus]
MLFDVSRDRLVSMVGAEAVFVATPGMLADIPDGVPGYEIMRTVGIPTGIFRPQAPLNSGCFPSVAEKIHLADYVAPTGAEAWKVFGWIPLTHLALDTSNGKVFGFSENGGSVQCLHADLSSLVKLTSELGALLKSFVPTEDDDEDYERRAAAVEHIRMEVAERDELPFHGDSIWPEVMEEIAAGMWS